MICIAPGRHGREGLLGLRLPQVIQVLSLFDEQFMLTAHVIA